jgi:phosphopantothenate synthetase
MRDIDNLLGGTKSKRECVAAPTDAHGVVVRERPSLVDHLLSEPPWDDDLAEAVNRRGKCRATVRLKPLSRGSKLAKLLKGAL